jgi:hypothetical protein
MLRHSYSRRTCRATWFLLGTLACDSDSKTVTPWDVPPSFTASRQPPMASASDSGARVTAPEDPKTAIFYRNRQRAMMGQVQRLRDALAGGDRESFARALPYPVTVNTDSRCTAIVLEPQAFVVAFDSIVTPNVRRAIVGAAEPLRDNGLEVGLEGGAIWFLSVDEDRVGKVIFNSDTWRLPGPCAGEPEGPVPAWLSGHWWVASVALLQGGQLRPQSPTTWINRQLSIDVASRTAQTSLNSRVGPCRLGRYAFRGDRSDSVVRELGAHRAGIPSEIPAEPFLDLECGDRDRFIQRVDVLSRDLLAVVGDDKYLLLLRRAPDAKRDTKPAARGDRCGNFDVECEIATVCFAESSATSPVEERCKLLAELEF